MILQFCYRFIILSDLLYEHDIIIETNAIMKITTLITITTFLNSTTVMEITVVTWDQYNENYDLDIRIFYNTLNHYSPQILG